MTRKHHRSGAWVSGYYRNGVWIEEHYRSDTTVSEFESSHHSWSIHESGKPITHTTACWWCGQQVFFYRDENGGCALFDELGAPWPIHECWEDHTRQGRITSEVEHELDSLGYDGAFFKTEWPRLTKPLEDENHVSITGYIVDNYSLYTEPEIINLRASRRSSTIPLVKFEVSDEENIYPFLIPQKYAESFPDFTLVDIKGVWLNKGRKWVLVATAIRHIDPFSEVGRYKRIIHAEGACCWCGGSIEPHIIWGLDNDGHQECGYCGELRGSIPREEFIMHIRQIAKVNV